MKTKMRVVLAILFLTLAAYGQDKELKVLFIGNSYTYGYNLAHIVSLISQETSTHLLTRKSVMPGVRLSDHWEGKRGLKTKELIAEGDFDIVILQDHSMSAIRSRESTLKYMGLFAEYIESHGARLYLFNTWARERVPQYQEEIDAMYAQGAEDNDAIRVPVGTAWELAMDLRPGVDLYTSDGSHPNELGCLLTAATFVKVICGELPESLPGLYRVEDAAGETIRLMNHNPEDAEFCRRIAIEATDQ